MTAELPTLEIGFGDGPATARLRAAAGYEAELKRLAARFRSAVSRGAKSVDVSLDDLLVNLVELARWLHRPVVWDPELAALATDAAADAKAVAGRLLDSDSLPVSLDVLGTLGPSWIADLQEFQRRDFQKLLGLRHGANFSVPGAGKTRVALAVFQALRQSGHVERLLVVCPKSAYEAWRSEGASAVVPMLNVKVFERTASEDVDVLAINYERLDANINTLAKWLSSRPTMMVLDEAHRIKLGSEGVYGSAALALAPRARRRLVLTGTPAPNGSKDLENLFSFVWPGYGRNAVSSAIAGGDLLQASKALRPLFTRTTKAELQLPPVNVSIRRLAMPTIHREVYDALIGDFSARATASQGDFEALGKITMYLLMAAISPALLTLGSARGERLAYRVPALTPPQGGKLFELMRDLPSYEFSPKYREVIAIVADNAAAGKKTIVWSTFVRSINTLATLLKDFCPAVVHGATEDRELQITRFREDKACMVLISNPATLGEGISLHHECHDAVYVDRDFAAGRFLQSLDRIHRLGMEKDTVTNIVVLASTRSIDEVVAHRLDMKLQFMGRILDDAALQQLADLPEEPPVGDGFSQEDLAALVDHLRDRTV